jgi:hypothetical protein
MWVCPIERFAMLWFKVAHVASNTPGFQHLIVLPRLLALLLEIICTKPANLQMQVDSQFSKAYYTLSN